MKCFPDKKKLKDFITTKPALQDMLKGLLSEEDQSMNNKIVINTYLSEITLNVNRLNASIKWHRVAECIRKQDLYITWPERPGQWKLWEMSKSQASSTPWPAQTRLGLMVTPATYKVLCHAQHWNGLYVCPHVPHSWPMADLILVPSEHLEVARGLSFKRICLAWGWEKPGQGGRRLFWNSPSSSSPEGWGLFLLWREFQLVFPSNKLLVWALG